MATVKAIPHGWVQPVLLSGPRTETTALALPSRPRAQRGRTGRSVTPPSLTSPYSSSSIANVSEKKNTNKPLPSRESSESCESKSVHHRCGVENKYNAPCTSRPFHVGGGVYYSGLRHYQRYIMYFSILFKCSTKMSSYNLCNHVHHVQ